ncbi:MAG: hypothetical protein IPN34_25615 [Planctomycetes bacterium]|nr:hypothetical protein [Planctomycetota bacterium]
MDSGTRRSDGRLAERDHADPTANAGRDLGHRPDRPPQPGKLRLFFAVAFAVTLAWRLGDAVLPASIPPLVLAAIAFGAPLAGALAAFALHRGLFDAIFDGTGEKARRIR